MGLLFSFFSPNNLAHKRKQIATETILIYFIYIFQQNSLQNQQNLEFVALWHIFWLGLFKSIMKRMFPWQQTFI